MKIAIIGGGAAGLCCSVAAARKALSENKKAEIVIYEAKDRVGKKILATGNGRCNMMNSQGVPMDFSDPVFVKPVLTKYSVDSNLEFFESMGLYTRQDEEGRIYPLSNQASSVLDALRLESSRLGVKMFCGEEIKSIKKSGDKFILNDGKSYDKVVLSCGGKAGNKNFGGYELLKNLGHSITKLSPALTKINVKETAYTKQLKGIRHKAMLSLYIDGKKKAEESGELLFADYGLSGIAVMQLSSIIGRHFKVSSTLPIVRCDFVPDMEFTVLCDNIKRIIQHDGNGKCENLLTGFMPKKLGEVVIKSQGISLNQSFSELTRQDVKNITAACKNFSFTATSLRSYEDAQVTSGGADNRQFDKYTLQSGKVKNLYCCGELLDVDGPCGGYNLWWAFSSGRAVGEALIE